MSGHEKTNQDKVAEIRASTFSIKIDLIKIQQSLDFFLHFLLQLYTLAFLHLSNIFVRSWFILKFGSILQHFMLGFSEMLLKKNECDIYF